MQAGEAGRVMEKLLDADGVAIQEGSVLYHIADGDRGVVVEIGKPGRSSDTPFMAVGDLRISLSIAAGLSRCTNCYAEWSHVSHSDQTYWERYLSWCQRKFEPEPYSRLPREEQRAIDGIMAVLPEDIVDDEHEGRPLSLEEALRLLVRHLMVRDDEAKGSAGGCSTCGENLDAGPCPPECRAPEFMHWIAKQDAGPGESDKMITFETIAQLFDRTNFGGSQETDAGRRGLMVEALLQRAAGYSCGSTITCICKEAGMLSSDLIPTREAMRWVFHQIYRG